LRLNYWGRLAISWQSCLTKSARWQRSEERQACMKVKSLEVDDD
jgi:hypothetical protein